MPGQAGDESGDTLTVAEPLSVMSFNVRYDDAASDPQGPDHWAGREPVAEKLLRTERPHLLGTQEPLFHQLETIARALPRHRQVGFGRSGGSNGEFNAIFYDTDRLTLTGWDQRWLSDTPDVIGSYGWGTTLPRIFVRCDFVDTVTGEAFTMINAHLDHASEEARVKGAAVLAAQVERPETPVIVTGDFNAPAQSAPAWQRLVDAGYRDSWLEAQQDQSGPGQPADDHHDQDAATFHGYGRGVHCQRIDWIMVRGPIGVASARINTLQVDGHWPSDHYPIQAQLTLGG